MPHSNVLLPAPGGPTTSVCARSPTCRLKRNTVEPVLVAYIKGSLFFGINAEEFTRSPVQIAAIGIQSARFNVCRMMRRTLRYPSPRQRAAPRLHCIEGFQARPKAEILDDLRNLPGAILHSLAVLIHQDDVS